MCKCSGAKFVVAAAVRERQLACAAKRNGAAVGYLAVGQDAPGHLPAPCGGFVACFGVAQLFAEVRREKRPAKAGFGRSKARYAGEQPGYHRTIGIVVETVHPVFSDVAVGLHAVPALPDGGSSEIHGIQPAGIRLVQQQVEGAFLLAEAG